MSSPTPSRPVARHYATISRRMARSAISSIPSPSTTVKVTLAARPAVAVRFRASSRRAARHSIAPSARSEEERMAYETLIVETRGNVGLITLNRPQALNALNSTVLADLKRAYADFHADEA